MAGMFCVQVGPRAGESQVNAHVAGAVSVNAVTPCPGPNDRQSGNSRIPLHIR